MTISKIAERKLLLKEIVVISWMEKTSMRNIKLAQEAEQSSISSTIKDALHSMWDPNEPVKSIVNFLAPGALAMVLGGGPFGMLAGVALDMFGIDVYGIIKSTLSSLLPSLHAGEPISNEQIDHATQNALNQQNFEQKTSSFNDYELKKHSGIVSFLTNPFKKLFMKGGEKTAKTFLQKVISFILRTTLASAGVAAGSIAAGKVLNIGRHSDTRTREVPRSTQTFFKLKNPSQSSIDYNTSTKTWTEDINNDEQSISNLILEIGEDVYDGLEKYKNLVRTSLGFKKVLDDIMFVNRLGGGARFVIIPKSYSNEKDIADMFIDEVANKVQLAQKKTQVN